MKSPAWYAQRARQLEVEADDLEGRAATMRRMGLHASAEALERRAASFRRDAEFCAGRAVDVAGAGR